MTKSLKFGNTVENIAASDRNPIKRGIFVRYVGSKMAEYVTKEGSHSTPADNLRLAAQSAAPVGNGCICQEQHRRGYCTEPGCSFALTPPPAAPVVVEIDDGSYTDDPRLADCVRIADAPPPSPPEVVGYLAFAWRCEAVKHNDAAAACDLGDEEWLLNQEVSRIYNKCACDLEAALPANPGNTEP